MPFLIQEKSMNNLSHTSKDFLLEAQAKWAKGVITYLLESFDDALRQDQNLSPELKDQISYLWCNEACELTLLPSKFRHQLRKSHYSHYDVEKAISNLENFICRIALVLPINSLFLS
jgi:hypothetical protein